MPTPIPRKIDSEEILVRFINDRDFKSKILDAQKFIHKSVLLPHQGGVSLQREKYCNENCCKKISKGFLVNSNKVYVGFLLFIKSDFDKFIEKYKSENRPDFEAEIISTPLDEELKLIGKSENIYTNTKGYPAHADIIYLNPAIRGDESTATAIRSFAKKFSEKLCKIVIDDMPNEKQYLKNSFSSYFK
ncbi:hypothetical protein [Winogradskyella poriferorum]|uniref:hypothetical protein n=1 Tax=Winogradskyella poriferorum TaxID=307627 RepID=UPI003D6510AB